MEISGVLLAVASSALRVTKVVLLESWQSADYVHVFFILIALLFQAGDPVSVLTSHHH